MIPLGGSEPSPTLTIIAIRTIPTPVAILTVIFQIAVAIAEALFVSQLLINDRQNANG